MPNIVDENEVEQLPKVNILFVKMGVILDLQTYPKTDIIYARSMAKGALFSFFDRFFEIFSSCWVRFFRFKTNISEIFSRNVV